MQYKLEEDNNFDKFEELFVSMDVVREIKIFQKQGRIVHRIGRENILYIYKL